MSINANFLHLNLQIPDQVRWKLVKMILIILLASFPLVNIIGQNDDYVPGMDIYNVNSANIIDRGSSFYNSSFINGELSISDFSGNLTIGHRMEINFPNDLKTSLTLTYNANTSSAYIEDMVANANYNGGAPGTVGIEGGNDHLGGRINTINAPGWIFAIGGIAIQTTNFEKNIYLDRKPAYQCDAPNALEPLSGLAVPILYPGYHYNNEIKFTGYYSPLMIGNIADTKLYDYWGESYDIYENLYMLNAEGSTIRFYNPRDRWVFRDYSDSLMIGVFFDLSEGSNGYAIVKWKNEILGPRAIYYKPGDGLTYYFEEEFAKYEGWNTDTVNYHIYNPYCERGNNAPRIAYLKEIRSQNGDKIFLNYDYSAFGQTILNGRKFLKSIIYCYASGTQSSEARITFNYLLVNNKYKIDVNNTLSGESYTLELNNYNPGDINNIIKDTISTYSNVMLISKIINNHNTNKYASFEYNELLYRKYSFAGLDSYIEVIPHPKEPSDLIRRNYLVDVYYLKYPIRLLTSRIVNGGGKNEFTYWSDTELNGTTLYGKGTNIADIMPDNYNGMPDIALAGYYTNTFSQNPAYSSFYATRRIAPWKNYFKSYHQGNMNYAARDNYTTTMIKTVTNSITKNQTQYKNINKKEYIYTWDKTLEISNNRPSALVFTTVQQDYTDESPCLHNICTTIKTTNLTDDTISIGNLFIKKSYFDYVTYSTPKLSTRNAIFNHRMNGKIELTKEIILDSKNVEIERIEYEYEHGSPFLSTIGGYSMDEFNFYNISKLNNNLINKKIYTNNNLKIKINYKFSEIRDTFKIPGYYYGEVYQAYPLSVTEIDEGVYAGANAKCKKDSIIYNNYFVPTLKGFTSQIYSDTNFIFKPSLSNSEIKQGKIGTSTTTWTRKSKKVNTYYTDGTKRHGKLKTETLYGKTDTRGVTTTYDYYTTGTNPGYLKSVASGNGLTTTFEYNDQVQYAMGTVLGYSGSKGNYSAYHTSFQAAPFKTTRSFTNAAGAAVNLVNYAAYDGKNNLRFALDENGYFSSNIYDVLGRIKYEYRPGSYYYHPILLDLFDQTVNHESVRYDYIDSLWVPKVTKYSYVDNSKSSYVATKSYFVPNDLMYVNSALSGTTEIPKSKEKLNYLGKKIYTEDGMQRKAYYYYDNFLNLSETRFTSNLATAPKQQQIVEYGNDPAYFKRIKLVDENGKYQYNYYDMFGNIIKNVKGNPGLTTEFTYNEINQLTSVKTPANKTTTYVYDDLGYVSQKTSPDEGTYRYKYDKYGNLRFEYHIGTSQLVYHMYDALNRLTATGLQSGFSSDAFNDLDPDIYDNASFSEGSPTNWVLKNMYDAFSRTGNFTDAPSLTISDGNFKGRLAATGYRDKTTNAWSYKVYDYDALGNIDNFYQSFEGGAVKTIANKYDNLGNLTYQNIDSKYYTWYKYDNQGRLIKCLSDPFGTESAANVDARYAYNNADQVTGLASLNGSTIADSLKYTYNTRSWVSQILRSGNNFVENLTYEANGNIYTQGITNTANSWSGLSYTYTYDAYNRLTASAFTPTLSESYTYNADGAITSKNRTNMNITYTYPAANNKLSGISVNGTGYALSYDARGNFLSNAYSKTYLSNYDRRNLPLKESAQYAESILYYDDNGNRIGKFYSSMGGAVNKEYYLRDHTGRELAIYDQVTGKIKFINLYGIGLIGRAEIY